MGYQFADTDQFIHYVHKGTLIAYLLDKQLTEDGSSLDELMRYMFQNFNHGQSLYSSEDLRDAANAITGEDYTKFFDDYVFGNAPLPMDVDTEFEFFWRDPSPYPMVNYCDPRECRPRDVLRIHGVGFGIPTSESQVHIGSKSYPATKRRIEKWNDVVIKLRMPSYECEWFKGKRYRKEKAWVTVGGVDSNKKTLRIMRPSECR
jgi:hypothetical protein